MGGLAALAIVLYLTQALLGALTVWKLLDPNVVSGHLAVGLLLFSTLLTLALSARHEAAPPAPRLRLTPCCCRWVICRWTWRGDVPCAPVSVWNCPQRSFSF